MKAQDKKYLYIGLAVAAAGGLYLYGKHQSDAAAVNNNLIAEIRAALWNWPVDRIEIGMQGLKTLSAADLATFHNYQVNYQLKQLPAPADLQARYVEIRTHLVNQGLWFV